MKLDELQLIFQNSMLTSTPEIHPFLETPPRGSVNERVAIYAEGFYTRLSGALEIDYPALYALMGEKKFSKMCRKYIEAYPSCNFSLNFYGEHLSQFLTDTEPYKYKPFLAEIALIEWAEELALVSEDAPRLLASNLQTIPIDSWADMRFKLHPSTHLLTLNWNSAALIEAARDKRSNLTVKRLEADEYLLIWRRQQTVQHCVLDNVSFDLLTEIKKGASFGELCEFLSLKIPEDEAANYIAKELHVWLGNQLFVI